MDRKVGWIATRDGIGRQEARLKLRDTIHGIKELWGLPGDFELRFFSDCTIADPVTDQELGFVYP